MERLVENIGLPDISWARWTFLVGAVFYTMGLHLSYAYVVSPAFAYLGFVYNPEGVLVVSVAKGLALLPALWMPVRIRRPSQVIYLLLYFWGMVPFLLVAAFTGVLVLSRILLMGVLLCMALGGIRLIYSFPLLRIPKIIKRQWEFWLFFLSVSGTLYGFLLLQYGFYTEIPSLSEVYTQRADFRQTVGGLSEYVFHWLAKAINPFLIAWGYTKRNIFLLGLGIGGQVMLFAMSGLKAILFSGLLLAAVAIALHREGSNFGNWIVWGLSALIGLTALIDSALNINITSSLFVRRLLFVPGLNASYFFDFFHQNSQTLFGHSVFGWFVDYPYNERPAMLIGDVYAASAPALDISANANFWADGYASFGIPGVLFFSILLGAVLWLADSLARGCRLEIAVLLLALPSYHLVDTKLQTTLLTHGLGVVLILLFFLPHEKTSDEPS